MEISETTNPITVNSFFDTLRRKLRANGFNVVDTDSKYLTKGRPQSPNVSDCNANYNSDINACYKIKSLAKA